MANFSMKQPKGCIPQNHPPVVCLIDFVFRLFYSTKSVQKSKMYGKLLYHSHQPTFHNVTIAGFRTELHTERTDSPLCTQLLTHCDATHANPFIALPSSETRPKTVNRHHPASYIRSVHKVRAH